MHQDRAGFEHADRLRPLRSISAGILEFGLTATKPLPNWSPSDLDQPGVVLRALVAERQQLFEHHRDLDAVRRRQRIELQRMASDRQFLVVGRPPR
jgi:hypothetical protein